MVSAFPVIRICNRQYHSPLRGAVEGQRSSAGEPSRFATAAVDARSPQMTAAVDGKGPAAMNTHFLDARNRANGSPLAVRPPPSTTRSRGGGGMPDEFELSSDPICSCVAPIRTGA